MSRHYASKELKKSNQRIFVSGRDDCFLAVTKDGHVKHAGRELFTDAEQPFSVSDWTDITALACAKSYLMGLKKDGTVRLQCCGGWAYEEARNWKNIVDIDWGYGFAVGLTADGHVVKTGKQFEEMKNWQNVVGVTACRHIVALKSDGTVVAAGDNSRGQCNVGDWTNIKAVAIGITHTVGLKKDGTVVATGSNAAVRCRDSADNYDIDEDNAGQCSVSEWTDIVDIAAGDGYTVGLRADGSLITTGSCYDLSDWFDIAEICETNNDMLIGIKKDGSILIKGRNAEIFSGYEYWHDIAAVKCGWSGMVGLKKDGTAVGIVRYPSKPGVKSKKTDNWKADDVPRSVEHGWKNIAVAAAGR